MATMTILYNTDGFHGTQSLFPWQVGVDINYNYLEIQQNEWFWIKASHTALQRSFWPGLKIKLVFIF